jgi:hypothetical protein
MPIINSIIDLSLNAKMYYWVLTLLNYNAVVFNACKFL